MGTKDEKNNLSNEFDTEDKDFNELSAALSAGDFENVDRLMAVKDEEKDKKPLDIPNTKDEKPDDKDDSDDSLEKDEPKEKEGQKDEIFGEEKDGEDDKSDEGKESNPEAASSAASTPKLPPEYEQELHRLRSDAGRVPYLQRRLSELERELRATKARTPKTSDDGNSPNKTADLSEVELDRETQKEIDELRENDPVLAKTLERVAKTAVLTANRRAEQVVESLRETDEEFENQKFYMEQKAELTRMIPEHEKVFAMPEWRQWKETLTPGQRALAESGYANEVSQAIYAFAADMQRAQRPAQKAADQGTNTNTPNDPPVQRNDEVIKARERKVAAGAEVKNPNAKSEEAFNEDKYFEEMYRQIGKKDHILP